jgi:P27 family predicted phage terminase small subunit
MSDKNVTPISPAVDSLGRKRSPNQDLGRAGRPQPGDGALTLKCPSFLDVRGKEAWKQAAAALRRKGILDTADGRLLELFASSYSIFRRAEALVKKNGLLINQPGPRGKTVKVKNPALDIRAKAWREVTELFSSLGIGPIARRKLFLTDSEDDAEEDAFAVLMRMRAERKQAAIEKAKANK